MDDIFAGHKLMIYKCQECGFQKANKDKFYALTLQAGGFVNLEASLRGMNEGDSISGWNCPGC